MNWIGLAVAALLVAACGSKHHNQPASEFWKAHAAKIDALRTNLPRATRAASAPEAANAPNDCKPLHLKLNGKRGPGNAEVLWFDEADDVLAGKLDKADDPHLVPRFLAAGWCQQLATSMYWMKQDNQGAKALDDSGVSPQVAGWIEAVLDLPYVIVLVPGEHVRGEQKIELRAVELASGTVKCQVEVIGHADPSLGFEHYQLIRKATGEKVGDVQSVDKYTEAIKADLVQKVGEGLSNQMAVDMRGYCQSAE